MIDATSFCRSSASTYPSYKHTMMAGTIWLYTAIAVAHTPAQKDRYAAQSYAVVDIPQCTLSSLQIISMLVNIPCEVQETDGNTLCLNPFVRIAHPSFAPRKASALVRHRRKVETQSRLKTSDKLTRLW